MISRRTFGHLAGMYYFATNRGIDGYRQNTHDFNKLIWTQASPKRTFDDATYDRTAQAFTNAAIWADRL